MIQRWTWGLTLGIAAQVAYLIYLAQLNWMGALVVSCVALFIALGINALASSSRWRSRWDVWELIGMLVLGSLGMLIGWWADVGFGPLIRKGLCLCGCPMSPLGWGIVVPLNWMYAGMLGGSLLANWLAFKCFPQFDLGPRWFQACCHLGMLLGMAAGTWAMVGFAVRNPVFHFFATFGTMNVGMVAGTLLMRKIFWLKAFRTEKPWKKSASQAC